MEVVAMLGVRKYLSREGIDMRMVAGERRPVILGLIGNPGLDHPNDEDLSLGTPAVETLDTHICFLFRYGLIA
jgi:hypothetical protein